MTKLYRRFVSALHGLETGNYFWARDILKAFYSEDEYYLFSSGNSFTLNHEMRVPAKEQLIGMLHPLFVIKRDIVKTFQPYRSKMQALKDFLQPLRGLLNILQGVVSVAVAAFRFFIVSPIIACWEGCSSVPYVENFLRDEALVLPFSWLTHGVLKIFQGAAQIATTPLTWLLRMPLRAALTLKFGYADFMQANGMKKLLALATDEKFNDPRFDASLAKPLISSKLATKFLKAQKAGSKLPADLDLSKSKFKNLYCFSYAQEYMNGTIVMHLLPNEIKRYFLMEKFMGLDGQAKQGIITSLNAIMEGDVSLDQKMHDVIKVLELHGLYNLRLLTLLAYKRNSQSSLNLLAKPVAHKIANMTMFRNTPSVESREDEITVATPLLQNYGV